ncbi:MAG: proline/glycine betaine ABC transporter permease [Candidatus Competibacteraceae bacterium]|nr:proline/glycine betaine ABC transporter permease [Candidatus Competibacteraceae bacterium]
MFPEELTIDLAGWVNDAVDWLVINYGDVFEMLSNSLLRVLVVLERFLRDLPWWLVVIFVGGLGWHARQAPGTLSRRLWRVCRSLSRPGPTLAWFQTAEPWRQLTGALWQTLRHPGLGLIMAAAMVAIGVLGHWDKAMQTLALMLVSTGISILIGIPLGILVSRSDRFRSVLLPVLDAMQTMPSFVYLIPALLLFGLGKVPAIFATVIYAVPPLIRLTDLGIRLVDQEVMEATRAFGASARQQLLGVQLPLALPNIMAGINQTTMMALSMVVVASMIGARGLGEEVLLGIQRLDVGRGAAAGIAIVLLAVVMDRITQSYGRRSAVHREKGE